VRKEIAESKISAMLLSESINADPAELIRGIKESGSDGVLAKRKDSSYESFPERAKSR